MGTGIGTVTNNLFYNGNGGYSWDSNPISADPLFVSTTTPDLHLLSGSPALGTGSSAVAATVTTDYDLSSSASGIISIGAYAN